MSFVNQQIITVNRVTSQGLGSVGPWKGVVLVTHFKIIRDDRKHPLTLTLIKPNTILTGVLHKLPVEKLKTRERNLWHIYNYLLMFSLCASVCVFKFSYRVKPVSFWVK